MFLGSNEAGLSSKWNKIKEKTIKYKTPIALFFFKTIIYCAFYTTNFLSMDLVNNIFEWLQVQCFFESNLKN